MKSSIRSQLEAYYAYIDEAQEPLSIDDIARIVDRGEELQPDSLWARTQPRPRAWLAVAVAVAALVVIGLAPLLLWSNEDSSPATTPTTLLSESQQGQIVGPAEEAGWQWLELDDRIFNSLSASGGRTSSLGVRGDGSVLALVQSESTDANLPTTPYVEIPSIETPDPRSEWSGVYSDWGCAPCELILADQDGNWRSRSLAGLGPIELYDLVLGADLLWAFRMVQTAEEVELWVSDDGDQWDPVKQDPFEPVFLPDDNWQQFVRRDDTVVAINQLTERNVFTSVDRGRTFESVAIPGRPHLVWTRPDAFYLLLDSEVLRSADGITWEQVGPTSTQQFPDNPPRFISVLVTPDGSLLAHGDSFRSDLWRSYDNGLSWERQDMPFDSHTTSIHADWIHAFERRGDNGTFRTLVSRDGVNWFYFDPSALRDLPYFGGTGAIVDGYQIAIPPAEG